MRLSRDPLLYRQEFITLAANFSAINRYLYPQGVRVSVAAEAIDPADEPQRQFPRDALLLPGALPPFDLLERPEQLFP